MNEVINVKPYSVLYKNQIIKMIAEFYHFHAKLLSPDEEFYTDTTQAEETLEIWKRSKDIYQVFLDDKPAGFLCTKAGRHNVVFLTEMFIAGEYRGLGIGRYALALVEDVLAAKGYDSLSVEVTPRNESAVKLYRESGFDYINTITLRKFFKDTVEQKKEIEFLGMDFLY